MASDFLIGRRRTQFGTRAGKGWAEYSRRKNQWLHEHPEATAKEIEAATKAIAKELGL